MYNVYPCVRVFYPTTACSSSSSSTLKKIAGFFLTATEIVSTCCLTQTWLAYVLRAIPKGGASKVILTAKSWADRLEHTFVFLNACTCAGGTL